MPFVKFLFGFIGAVVGLILGLVLTGDALGHQSWTTSLCAGLGFAIGRLIASALFGDRGRPPLLGAEKTQTDKDWEVKMLLRQALVCQAREQWDQARGLFEQVIQKADRPEDAETARRNLEAIRNVRSTQVQSSR